MAKGFKYTKEDVLSEMAEILNKAEASGPGGGTAKPGMLERMKSKAGLNRMKDERV